MINFDANATARPTASVFKALVAFLQSAAGNPSSSHAGGIAARTYLSDSRERLAELVGVDPERIVFTSGATEANNIVLRGAVTEFPPRQIVSTQVEHPSILVTLDVLGDLGVPVKLLKVDNCGEILFDDLGRSLDSPTSLVSIHWVNSETGVVQPIRRIAELCRDRGVPLHVDAAQAVGRIDVAADIDQIDFLTLSGHKFHAPSGTGAIVAKDRSALSPLFFGGGQEGGARSGTENMLGIVGMGQAALDRKARMVEVMNHLRSISSTFERMVLEAVSEAEVVGGHGKRVGNTSTIRFKGVDGQALVAQLSDQGLMCSQGSACHNNRPEPSHVYLAMGYQESEAYECVRFSFSELNDMSEIEPAVELIASCVNRLRLFI